MLALAPRNLDLSRSTWEHSPLLPSSEAPQFSLELFEGSMVALLRWLGWRRTLLSPERIHPGWILSREDEFCCIAPATCRAGSPRGDQAAAIHGRIIN